MFNNIYKIGLIALLGTSFLLGSCAKKNDYTCVCTTNASTLPGQVPTPTRIEFYDKTKREARLDCDKYIYSLGDIVTNCQIELR